MTQQKVLSGGDGIQNTGNQRFLIYRWVCPALATHIGGIVRQGLSQGLHDSDVIHDQAVALPLCHPVGPGDGLHQGVGL